jgi:CRP-like cAMP-binding protein
MDLLKPLFEPYTCNAGATVLKQGESADYLYLVVSGAVEMTYKPYDGIPITISHVEKDGLFGWSAVVGSEKYTSSAIAIENIEALRVRGSELRKLCADHPEAGKEILERLASSVSSRVQNAQEQVKSILKQGMKNKRD